MAIQELLLDKVLSQFVDREAEMRRFCAMLTSDTKHIMLLWGESGMGKTWLLQKMMHECAQRSLRKAKVIWTDTSCWDYLWIMRIIRDDLSCGEAPFLRFTDLVNQYYGSSQPTQFVLNISSGQSVLDHATITNATVGEIAHTIVKDNMFVMQRPDLNISVKELQIRLTDAFIKDLQLLTKHEPMIVFLDAAEKMSGDTDKWVWDELLRAVFEERIRNTKFVICGQRRHELPEDWSLMVEEAELQPLSKPHIVEYLTRRKVPAEQIELVAQWLLATTKGRIKDIAVQVQMYISFRESQGDP